MEKAGRIYHGKVVDRSGSKQLFTKTKKISFFLGGAPPNFLHFAGMREAARYRHSSVPEGERDTGRHLVDFFSSSPLPPYLG